MRGFIASITLVVPIVLASEALAEPPPRPAWPAEERAFREDIEVGHVFRSNMADGLHAPRHVANGSLANVFHVTTDAGPRALRLFRYPEAEGNARVVYTTIERPNDAGAARPSSWPAVRWHEHAAHRHTTIVPGNTVEWFDDVPLGIWLKRRVYDRDFRDFHEQWPRMNAEHSALGVSHGDLQPNNIWVREHNRSHISLHVSDLDNALFPGLESHPITRIGEFYAVPRNASHPWYAIFPEQYRRAIWNDHFPAALIALMAEGIEHDPRLTRLINPAGLIFTMDDLLDPTGPRAVVFRDLERSPSLFVQRLTAQIIDLARHHRPWDVPDVGTILRDAR